MVIQQRRYRQGLCNKEVHFGCICGSIPLPDLNMVGDELLLGVF